MILLLRTQQLVRSLFHCGLTSIQHLEDSLSSHILCCFKHKRCYITFLHIKQFKKIINVREIAVLTHGNLLYFSFVSLIPWLVRSVDDSLSCTNIPCTDLLRELLSAEDLRKKINSPRLGKCNIKSQFLCGEEINPYFCVMIIILEWPWDFVLECKFCVCHQASVEEAELYTHVVGTNAVWAEPNQESFLWFS